MNILTQEMIAAVLAQYQLDPQGAHGPNHWARVYYNGMMLAERTGANAKVVQLFALFHDSGRIGELHDDGHGRRGAVIAVELLEGFGITRDELALLGVACHHHTGLKTHFDITVKTCFDADRLDLPRVGITVDPKLLCTDAARDPLVIRWTTMRAIKGEVPFNPLSKAWADMDEHWRAA